MEHGQVFVVSKKVVFKLSQAIVEFDLNLFFYSIWTNSTGKSSLGVFSFRTAMRSFADLERVFRCCSSSVGVWSIMSRSGSENVGFNSCFFFEVDDKVRNLGLKTPERWNEIKVPSTSLLFLSTPVVVSSVLSNSNESALALWSVVGYRVSTTQNNEMNKRRSYVSRIVTLRLPWQCSCFCFVINGLLEKLDCFARVGWLW